MDTIKVISFMDNTLTFKNAFNFLEDNFTSRYNDRNPENKMDDFKMYRLYMLKNMSIKLYTNRTVLQGSIPIYCSGSNVVELSDSDIKKAFEQIQFQLPFVNWSKGIISRLDIGPCFNVPFNPNVVINLITGSKYSHKVTYRSNGETVIIGNKSHQFEIYNKSAQYGGEENNILRLEYKMLKSAYVGKMFNEKSINLEYLLDNLNILPEIWFEMYQKLEKDYSPVIDLITDKTTLKHATYHSYGYERIISLIDNSYKNDKLTTSQSYSLKRYIRNMQREAKRFAHDNSPMIVLDNMANEYITKRRDSYNTFK